MVNELKPGTVGSLVMLGALGMHLASRWWFAAPHIDLVALGAVAFVSAELAFAVCKAVAWAYRQM